MMWLLMTLLFTRFLKVVLKFSHLGPGIYPHISDPGASDMSIMVVPDEIHHILDYAEVLDIIRAHLVLQQP